MQVPDFISYTQEVLNGFTIFIHLGTVKFEMKYLTKWKYNSYTLLSRPHFRYFPVLSYHTPNYHYTVLMQYHVGTLLTVESTLK